MWKSRSLFAFALVCAVQMARLYENRDIGVIAIYALLLLLACSLTAVLTAPFFLKIEEQSGQLDLDRDDALSYRSRIINRGIFFYPRIACDYYSAEVLSYGEASIAVGPRQKWRGESEITFPYRGVFKLGIKRVSVTDFLGLFRITFGVNNPLTVTVFPKSSDAFSLYLRRDAQNAAFKYDRYNENYADVADVRKYTPSDSLRKIHWKLSAKRSELMVKNFQTLEPNETLLYLDATKTRLPHRDSAVFEDQVVSFVAGAVNHCAQSRLSAQLIWGAGEEERVTVDPGDALERAYRKLAQAAYDRDQSDFPAFCRSLGQTSAGYNILLFLHDLDDRVVDAIQQFSSHDNAIHLYYFYSAALPAAESVRQRLDSLKALGVTVNQVEV